MSAVSTSIVDRLHAHPDAGVFYVTSGGSYLLADLLTAPGASATVLEARIPYASDALSELLGGAPDQSCSAATGRALAMQAFQRARALGGSFGLGLTASLRSSAPKRGDHRFHIAVQTATATHSFSRVLPKGKGTRTDEERTTADTALTALAYCLGIGTAPNIDHASATPEDSIARLLDASPHVVGPRATAVFPGAFNPLHDGHRQMHRIAAELLGESVAFELCVKNADKPPLDFIEIATRQRQFEADELILSNTATFIEKARAIATPGRRTTFVVGADTMVRIGQVHYYESVDHMRDVIDEFADLDCHFLVFGRMSDDEFQSLDDLDIPASLRTIATGVPENVFRQDISSSALRHAR